MKINCASLKNAAIVDELRAQAAEIEARTIEREREILAIVDAKI